MDETICDNWPRSQASSTTPPLDSVNDDTDNEDADDDESDWPLHLGPNWDCLVVVDDYKSRIFVFTLKNKNERDLNSILTLKACVLVCVYNKKSLKLTSKK